MCKYKEVRRNYGTIQYEQRNIEVPELKINYNELFEFKRDEDDLLEIEEQQLKKVEIKNKTKEEKIQELIHESSNIPETIDKELDEEIKKEQTIEEQDKIEEEQEKIEEADKMKSIEQELKESEELEEPEPEPEPETEEQKGGLSLKKTIRVTNLSVDKDKEMFQM